MTGFYFICMVFMFISGLISLSYGEQKRLEYHSIDKKEEYYNKRIASVFLEVFGGFCFIFALVLLFAMLTHIFGIDAMLGI